MWDSSKTEEKAGGNFEGEWSSRHQLKDWRVLVIIAVYFDNKKGEIDVKL